MARLIDVDKMIDFLKKAAALEDDAATKTLDKFGVQFIERVINHYVQITEKNLGHAEDIVRCKDCTIRFDACPMAVRIGSVIQIFTEDEDFCSRGRRENDVDAKGKG